MPDRIRNGDSTIKEGRATPYSPPPRRSCSFQDPALSSSYIPDGTTMGFTQSQAKVQIKLNCQEEESNPLLSSDLTVSFSPSSRPRHLLPKDIHASIPSGTPPPYAMLSMQETVAGWYFPTGRSQEDDDFGIETVGGSVSMTVCGGVGKSNQGGEVVLPDRPKPKDDVVEVHICRLSAEVSAYLNVEWEVLQHRLNQSDDGEDDDGGDDDGGGDDGGGDPATSTKSLLQNGQHELDLWERWYFLTSLSQRVIKLKR
ncbi:hypothetical protein VTL71DRAFT_852 [Oculimacula yallundae]|uniref:Uncharacterized protein n=1 Tax=Oculimacula yallundae TaxID=86028 RepID=A0ABR4D179_9HELO